MDIGWCLGRRIDKGVSVQSRIVQVTGTDTKGVNIELAFWDGSAEDQPEEDYFDGIPIRDDYVPEPKTEASGQRAGVIDVEAAQLTAIKEPLTDEERLQFDAQYAEKRKSATTALVLSVFLGLFGVDRFYLGQIVLGCLKLLSLGGYFMWALLDMFLITGATRRANVRRAEGIARSIIEMRG